MPTLRELQHGFADAIIGRRHTAIDRCIVDDAPGAAARMAIYGNHFRATLVDALSATYPVVVQLVGDAFFRSAAGRYVRVSPPCSPCLFEYGGSFPAFLKSLPEAASVPYLADVARLEWAINLAWHAPDRPPFDGETVAGTTVDHIGVHSSCRLVTSPFPIDRIWQDHQSSCSEIAAVDFNVGPVRLLVHRQDDAVGWIALPEAESVFVGTLIADGNVGKATAIARAITVGFDPAPFVAVLIDGGLIAPNLSSRH